MIFKGIFDMHITFVRTKSVSAVGNCHRTSEFDNGSYISKHAVNTNKV